MKYGKHKRTASVLLPLHEGSIAVKFIEQKEAAGCRRPENEEGGSVDVWVNEHGIAIWKGKRALEVGDGHSCSPA